jgi:hypothetical protein
MIQQRRSVPGMQGVHGFNQEGIRERDIHFSGFFQGN